MPHEAFLKRTACQIAAQLPDDPKDADRVIALVWEIVHNLGRSPVSLPCVFARPRLVASQGDERVIRRACPYTASLE